ncbi:MAG: amidohydrolase family protein [Spirochaetia bacterium]|jgi:5-methylthioadenosine/S-adenosylhomocysteine deaminase|nr:amidohydrolase family protein [Spirochaetia bacterium]
MSRIVLENATVIDRVGRIAGPWTVVVDGGIISAVEGMAQTTETGFRRLPGDEIVDCSRLHLTPGLVNLHTHSPMNIFKGIAEDARADRWFNEEIWPYESKMDGDDVEAGAALAIAEMLDNGVTAFADHYFLAERVCAAVEKSGIRADVAPTLFGMAGDFAGQLARAGELVREWNGRSGRISIRLGPHSPYTCSPEELAACAKTAASLDVGAHIHVEDSEPQIAASVATYGRTPLRVVADSGLLDLPTIIGHGYWILDEERELLKSDNWIAVCMKTYMKLGEGPGRVWQRPDELPLCIGSDGAASSNTLSPLEQARLLALLAKYQEHDAEVFPLDAIWKMLMRGHEALPFGSGRIEAGAPADIVLWDLRRPNTFPAYNPLAALVYSADASNVKHSMVAGVWVKKDGKLFLDVDAIVARAAERAAGILRKGKGKTDLAF